MAGERLRAAMSDLAETIRRVFQAPAAHPVPVGWNLALPGRIPALDVSLGLPFDPCAATARQEGLLGTGPALAAGLAFTPSVGGEPGWATWETGARICALPMFQTEPCARLAVPPLPRRAAVRSQPIEAMTTRARSGREPFPPPGVRPGFQALDPPRSRRGLERVLGLPVAVAGEDLGKVSKALWMRYTLQLVRSTGENIRNLEVIGLYRIPAKGTRELHHDPATGRLLVTLTAEASGARRSLFILARRKTDATIVFCFVEEA
jgi:hypothetical protein